MDIELANVRLTDGELQFLKKVCTYLNPTYLHYLVNFRFRPKEQIQLSFMPEEESDSDDVHGEISLMTKGLWVETILYEIPLLALVSEAYFKFCDRDWVYDGQLEKARDKGLFLLKNGCIFSEFGSRRRRDYHTHDLVLQGLIEARDSAEKDWTGKFSGTSNVHFAHRYGLQPVGTVAHEWFMGVAAITNNYEQASEIALRHWVGTFGEGILGIALTDTYGTPTFLKAFQQRIPAYSTALPGAATTAPSASGQQATETTDPLATTKPPIQAPHSEDDTRQTYAQVFQGVRQDSGDPEDFIRMMREFYDSEGITEKKTMVFSDSLNLELCLKYKKAAEAKGFLPTFGVGTFLTSKSYPFPGLHLIQEQSN
jgi:nicotinate phosphoribosyltransferase